MQPKVIDFHVHPLPLLSYEEIINEMNASNVVKAVLLAMELDSSILHEKKFKKELNSSFDYTNILDLDPIFTGMESILTNGHTPNEHVAKLIETNNDRFIGFGSVQIGHKSKKYIENKLKDIKNLKEELGFKGIKILPTLQFFNPESSSGLQQVFKFAEKEDLIILYHTGCDPGPWEIPLVSRYGNPALLESLLDKFKVKVVMAHLGSYSSLHPGIWLKESLKILKNYPNVYGDLSAVPYLVANKEQVSSMREVTPEMKKILFGSDYPVTSAGAKTGMLSTINLVNSSPHLTDVEKENIFYSNAYELLFEN